MDYLLAIGPDISEDAAGKSKFFHGIGFSRSLPDVLHHGLVNHPDVATLMSSKTTQWGERRVFQCFLPEVPNQRHYCIRSVWTEQQDGDFWLSTAYVF